MSSFTVLALPVILWLFPVWCVVALYCAAMAERKNLSAGEWFFRGMVLNIVALSEIILEQTAEPIASHTLNPEESLQYPATINVLSVLLILIGIPFYSILFTVIFLLAWRSLEGNLLPVSLGVYWLYQCLMWFPLVWLVSFLSCVPLARYKGIDGKPWSWLATVGVELSVWMLLKVDSDYQSQGRREHFLEDELTRKLVDRLMLAIAIPCRLGAVIVLILCLSLLLARLFPGSYLPFPISLRDVVVGLLAFCFCFSGWLLPASLSWSLAAGKGYDRVKWTLLGFFIMGFAPLALSFKKAAFSDTSAPIFSADSKIEDILRYLVIYAQIPWTAGICLFFGLSLGKDWHLFSNWDVSAALLPVLEFLFLGQLLFCPLLLVLFFLVKGRRLLSDILAPGGPRGIFALAGIHLFCFTLLLCYGIIAVCHSGFNY